MPWHTQVVSGRLEGAANDFRYALRMLRNSPGVTAVAVLSLALGIGANTAIFTLIESTLLRPISVKHLDRLRLLQWREQWGGWTAPNLGYLSYSFGSIYEQGETPDSGIIHTDFSPPVYREFLRSNTVFESLFSFKELGRATAVVDGSAEPVSCFLVSGDFYHGMDVSPAIGRAIDPANDVRNQQSAVAVISYEYWTRRFSRNPDVIGKTVTLNEIPITIIGVNPEYFTGIEPGAKFDFWAPLSLAPALIGRSIMDEANAWQIPVMGRLKPGISDAQAQSAMDALFEAAVDANPGPIGGMLQDPAKRPRLILQSAARGVDYLTQRYQRMMLAVLALASLVLLIACANVANLLLAKSAMRQREISLRLALGANRGRIVRQLLVEGLLLATMAGAAGVLLGYWTRNAIPSLLATPWRPNPFSTAFDLRIFAVTTGVTFLTGVLFSLAPAWQSRRVEVNEALKDGSRGTAGLSKLRAGRLLVVFQVALSVLLLAGAGLCVTTFSNVRRIPVGFRPEGVLLFNLDPPRLRYSEDRLAALVEQLRDRLNAVPGVQSATFSRSSAEVTVGSRFFDLMGIPILYGRAIDEHDSASGTAVAVVNRTFMRRNFNDEIPLGRTIKGSGGVAYQIVGVCADWRLDHLRDTVNPAVYVPLLRTNFRATLSADETTLHRPSTPVTFELKIAGKEAAIVPQIRQSIRSLDSSLTVTDVRTAEEQIDDGLSSERLLASLAAVFGGLAVILATIGIYGVMAYAVVRRTSEIGIRVALGARPAGVSWMVLRETLALAAAGVVIGVPAVIVLSPVADHFLASGWRQNFAFGLKPDDPAMLAAVIVALGVVAAAAGYLPARKAAKVDPMTALRHN